MSLLNWGGGLSAMGSSVAAFAHDAGAAQQKADLERQQTVLADQLATTRETNLETQRQQGQKDLVPIQAEATKGVQIATQQEAGAQQRQTQEAATKLDLSPVQEAEIKIKQQEANARTTEANRPQSAGFGPGWIVPDKNSPDGYKVISVTGTGGGASSQPDPSSNNLSTQINLSKNAINALTGELTGRAAVPYMNEAEAWARKNNVNIDTLSASAKAIKETLKATSERNQLGVIQERELMGSIETLRPILDDMNAGKINKANVLKIWGGGQVNDPAAMKAVDQLTRLREELAGYNAIANAKITNGHPNPERNELDAADKVITFGLNNGSLKAFGESIASSAQKNREILQKSEEDANDKLFSLFGGKFHRTIPVDADKSPPAAGDTKPPPEVKTPPKLPPGVPSGSRPNQDGTRFLDNNGKVYDATGKFIGMVDANGNFVEKK